MILTSPSEASGRTPPTRGTIPQPGGTTAGGGLDWHRVVTLHAFVRARAFERLHEAERSRDRSARREHRQSILAIDAMFTQARHGDPLVAACAVTFFRVRAMRDANHPDFLGEWLGTPPAEPETG